MMGGDDPDFEHYATREALLEARLIKTMEALRELEQMPKVMWPLAISAIRVDIKGDLELKPSEEPK